MSRIIDLDRISLGPDGQAILDDDMLEALAADVDLVLAGAGDPGGTNQSRCSNTGNCTNTSNTNCTNSGNCTGAVNFGCRGGGDGREEN